MWLSGHTHQDEIGEVEGIKYVITTTDSRYNSEKDRIETTGTIEDHSFDVFTVDKKRQKVYITRIGKGLDREMEYETF